VTSPAQVASRRAFADQRRAISAADRRLHTAPPKSVDVLGGLWQCAGCLELRWGGERRLAPGRGPFAVLFYDPGCADAA